MLSKQLFFLDKFKIQMSKVVALGITLSGAASLSCPINPSTYPFSLSRYPTNGGAVAQFPDDSRASYRGKFYIRLDVRGSVKKTFKQNWMVLMSKR